MLIHLLLCHPESYPIMHRESWLLQQVGPGTGLLTCYALPNVGQPRQASSPEDLQHSQEGLSFSPRDSSLKLASLLVGQDHLNSLEISISLEGEGHF